MVDAKIFMATERNGHNGQIFEALRSRFPEIPEQVISNTLQAEVGRFLIPMLGRIWTVFGYFYQELYGEIMCVNLNAFDFELFPKTLCFLSFRRLFMWRCCLVNIACSPDNINILG